jgi:hypothetical protein
MIGFVRRMGIAIGSLVAAALSVGLLWALAQWAVTALGLPIDIGGPLSPAAAFLLFLGTFLTGGLIYRDILRRERRT